MPRTRRPLRVASLLAVAFLAAGLYLAAELTLLDGRLGLPLDDAWIHLTFARNLADGHGLAYNPGEPVAGTTSPLWTALLAPVVAWAQALPGSQAGSAMVWAKLLSALFYLAIAPAADRLGRALGLAPGLAWAGAALTAASSWLVWSAGAGMEVPLFTLLSVQAMALHAEERADPTRRPLALGLFGLAALVRPEGLLLLALAVADACFVPRRENGTLRLGRPPWRRIGLGLGLAAAALAVPLAWFWSAVGSPLPTTFAAKSGGLHPPQGRVLFAALGVLFQPQPWATLFAAAGALRLTDRSGRPNADDGGAPGDRGLLPALWLFALPLAYAVLSPPGRTLVGNFGRYLFPLLPVVVVLGLLGFEPWGRRLPRLVRLGRLGLPVRPLAAAVIVVPTVLALLAGAGRYAHHVADVTDGDVAMAAWVRENLPADAVLAVQDIGALGYLTPNRLVDLSGIATPRIVPAVRAAQRDGDAGGRRGMEEFLAAVRPDYLIVFADWYPQLTADRARFAPIHQITVPGNVTLADDRIVVWAARWSGYNPARPDPTTESPAEIPMSPIP